MPSAAVNLPINFINKCGYKIYVKSFTAIANHPLTEVGKLGPGEQRQITVSNSYNDVEFFPLKNCKGNGDAGCESGGCRSVSFKMANKNNR